MKKITFLLLLCLAFMANHSVAQVNNMQEVELFGKKKLINNGSVIRCATTEYEEYLKSKNSNRPSINQFEKWIAPKIALEKKKNLNPSKTQRTNAIITIPVVVHVIHSRDLIGTDENISDGQVESQIRVLNEDFRRRPNTPGFNTNPVGADVEIEFVLAKRDPAGVTSNGINRVNLLQGNWSTEDIDNFVKPQTQWDPEKYLNIWVVKFANTELLGYAQFPSQSGLTGLNSNEGSALTDGVVIGYKFFGSNTYFPGGTYFPVFDKGRTTTHEVGHWLGLRHIWGDGDSASGCSVDDFCDDTPNTAKENEGCPVNVDSCPSQGNDMIENYMDYTNDACMNIFTNDQKLRMITVMNNSPRRVALKTSDALEPGFIYVNDGAISIVSLNLNSCTTTFSPTVKLTNKGSAILTSATITYSVDNANVRTINWTGNLSNSASAEITLDAITASGGKRNFKIEINNVNTTTDQNIKNNVSSIDFDLIKSYSGNTVTLTLQLDEYGSETDWQLTNSAGTVVYKGGPYNDTTTSPAVITEVFNLPNDECYTFKMFDNYGDGFCCENGTGYYNLKTATENIVVSDARFEAEESTSFRIGTLSRNDSKELSSVTVYPNPVTSLLNINTENQLESPTSYTIFNLLGQIIKSKKLNPAENQQINVTSLSQGIYLLKLVKNDVGTTTIRFIKK
ncbi:M43 family zinc metalloprotease [Flavobacterium sp. PL12]|uniref:M43 family zinc metalloprotease n=1 Tax=Flavobacterium sp. PL12 TaxID=3071718 RepID=UPI00319E14EF